MGKIDLHVHTRASSDGELSGEEIIKLAVSEGVTTLAITDHDSIQEVASAMHWGQSLGVEVIPGTEIFCKKGDQFIHMLAYYIETDNSAITRMLHDINEDRKRWVKVQLQLLEKDGFYAQEQKVYEFCGNTPPLYSAIAYAVFEDKRNEQHPIILEYKDKYRNPLHEMSVRLLTIGKPYFSPHFVPETKEVIESILESGGVPILAHPGYDQMKVDTEFIGELVKQGLLGVEAYYITHTEEETKKYLDYCKKHHLIYTCGSDFHGKYKSWITLGELNITDYSIVERLKTEAKKE